MMPAAATSLPRRIARRARRELAARRRVTVRTVGERPRRFSGQRVRLVLPDASALVRLATSGRLTGQVSELTVDLAVVPGWVVRAVRPASLGRTASAFTWRRDGSRLQVTMHWSKPYDLHRAFSDVLRATLRSRPWDQASGPVYSLDRAAWQSGASSWPQGRLAAGPPDVELDDLGRPAAPFLPAPAPAGSLSEPVVTAVANPYGRRLFGTAKSYRLAVAPGRVELRNPAGQSVWHASSETGPATALARGGLAKYAVVTVEAPPGDDALVAATVRTLAACGIVFAAPEPSVRTALDALGVVTVAEPSDVDDLAGYALSVEAARRMAIRGDAALRRTTLCPDGDGALPLPTVTAIVPTMRAEHLDSLLAYLAAQTYPAIEVVLGLHGYDLPDSKRDQLVGALPFPLRIATFPREETLGAILGRLSRMAEGELITKLDDDDHYGPNHVTDLVIAWHTTGADIVAKGARFVHLLERNETIDRAWAAAEIFDVSPAGGTLLLSRGALAAAGGWSHSSKHVDTDLLTRIKSGGGLVYRTHALEYVYVRRATGHTFVTGFDRLLSQAKATYPGLPDAIVRPRADVGRITTTLL